MVTRSNVAKLGHVAFYTPDLDESAWFFRDLLGLEEVARDDDAVYLRGTRDYQHHTMSLTEADGAGVDHVGWRCSHPDAVDELADRFDDTDTTVEWIEPGTIEGVGEAVRVRTPTGHPYVYYYDIEKPDVPPERRSKLPNRRTNPAVTNRVAPRRIDHVHVQDPRGDDHAAWLEDLGFRVNELFRSDDGPVWGWWMSVTALPHDVGVHRIEEGAARFHHVSYHVDRLTELWDCADILREYGIAPDAGPGKHAITNADFLYVRDPASGIRLELYAGPGYLVFEPDWEPIEWTRETIGTEADHQWIGDQYSPEGTPYLRGR